MNTVIIIFGTLITYSIILPVLEQISGVLCSWLEVLKGVATYHIQKINKAICDLDEPEQNAQCIGFEIPPNYEYYEDEDFEEEEDKKNNKIGF